MEIESEKLIYLPCTPQQITSFYIVRRGECEPGASIAKQSD